MSRGIRMMELPLCKICGERHHLGFCPKYQGSGDGLQTRSHDGLVDTAAQRRAWLQAMTGSPQPVTQALKAGPACTEPVAMTTPPLPETLIPHHEQQQNDNRIHDPDDQRDHGHAIDEV